MVTVVYRVCQAAVCSNATVTITVPASGDMDGDGDPDNTDPAPGDACLWGPNQVLANATATWRNADCDLDGLNNGEEVTGIDDLATPAVQPTNTTSNPNSICDPLQLASSCGSTACVNITAHVWLEGAFSDGSMSTKLNDLGYLPEQDPSTFLGTETTAGQPYNGTPWNYAGTEGNMMTYTTVGNAKAGYSGTVVDWVLVSLRTGLDRATTVCTRAALLHADGHLEFISGSDCCDINTGTSYYVVIEHRNHLIVMSDQAMPVVNGTITYDFRTKQSHKGLLGFGQKALGLGTYVMYAGNGDQASEINGNRILNIIVSDKDLWLEENGDHSSYYLNDFDLNGDVNVQDKNLWLENNGKFSDIKWEN
ncbi:MAG: hypothetical protein AB8G86_11300 [Saprospiraceae bacterium]